MKRKVLLIEPNYKNKYPPMGLMKLSTYHKSIGDDVTFYKGDFRKFVLEETYKDLLIKLTKNDNNVDWTDYSEIIKEYLKKGLKKNYEQLCQISKDVIVHENLKFYRDYYLKKRYLENPKWDRICITTLFTFYWKKTIDTINSFKLLCKDINEVKVGGIAASVVPNEIKKETGIFPFIGLLDKGGEYDSNNNTIIDQLPLDYSILDEINYIYPENDGYYGYMTRGCINKCAFCAVPKLEPDFKNFISIKNQIDYVKKNFGEKRNLLLLDNNVLASDKFPEIIDEIKLCGFDKKTKYIAPNQYQIAINGLHSGYNDKGYIKSIVKQYKLLNSKLTNDDQINMYEILKENKLLKQSTAKKEVILKLNGYFAPYFEKFYQNNPKQRYVDFNQGIDARLVTDEKMRKLAEIPIRPLRIAFDNWNLRDTYENAIRLAAKYGIRNMSNYLLYNYNEYPIDLYYRMKLNIELCEELGVIIYSFPMKYHPIQEIKYFKHRTYLGKHWNRKFIRAIQAVMNSTKGKIGRGKSFFEEAFGRNEVEFEKLLYMPEAMIIYRMYFKDSGITDQWWRDFNSLSSDKLNDLKAHVHENDFTDIRKLTDNKDILRVLEYYTIEREDAEKILHKNRLKNIK